MRVIIIDDEIGARNAVAGLLNSLFSDMEIVSSVGTVDEAYRVIKQYVPDLVFLDIELPDGTGFDLINKLKEITFKIIFITGHREYAIDAIKVSAVDYILKPFDPDELKSAVDKARRAVNLEEEHLKLMTLEENIKNRKVFKRIILSTTDHFQLVLVSDIIRAEAESNYTHFYLTDGRHHMVSRTIKEFDRMLSASGMVRVHQSHLVNLNYIDRYIKKEGGSLLLRDGSKIPVSPGLKKQVLKAIKNHLYE